MIAGYQWHRTPPCNSPAIELVFFISFVGNPYNCLPKHSAQAVLFRLPGLFVNQKTSLLMEQIQANPPA